MSSSLDAHLRITPPGLTFTRRSFSTLYIWILLTISCNYLGCCEYSDLSFKSRETFAQLEILGFSTLGACRQVGVVTPPVQTDLLGFIDRANKQTNLQGE